jgi:hypothetical protein
VGFRMIRVNPMCGRWASHSLRFLLDGHHLRRRMESSSNRARTWRSTGREQSVVFYFSLITYFQCSIHDNQMRGKWVGTWSFSKPMEKLLQRMVSPNADLRCTASQAMADSFWKAPGAEASSNLHSTYRPSFMMRKPLIHYFRARLQLQFIYRLRERHG